MIGIKVVGKRKCMKRLEPAVIGIASFLTSSDFVHGILLEHTIASNKLIKKRKI
jgi:hypothetical protein